MPTETVSATAAHVRLLQSPEATQQARHEAFAALVAAYQDMACGYALAQLGNWPAAQDAAQDAFILAYQQIGQLHEPAAFGAWLKRIVWSQCSRTRRAPVTEPLPADELGLCAPDDAQPAVASEAAAWRQQVLAAVQALPAHERDAVLLYYIDGYAPREVAAFLEISEPALRKRLQRARDHLREAMMDLLRDSLAAERPSRDDAFLRAVQLATTLEEAAVEAQIAVLEAALVDGIDVNAAGASGQTLLHWAARQGNLEALTLLLRNGADPALLDRLGRTPLRVALDAGQSRAADLLRRWAARHTAPEPQEPRP